MLVSGFKDFMLDAPVASVAALALYLLIRSREFRVPWASLLFGGEEFPVEEVAKFATIHR